MISFLLTIIRKLKKRLSSHDVDKRLNPLSPPKEAKIINDVQVKAIKDDKTNDEYQEDAIIISTNRIIIHELPEFLLNEKYPKFGIVEYLCPLGYGIPSRCSNINFENPKKVKRHLLWFHRVPFHKIENRLQMGLSFPPIERITYKY